MPVPKYDDLTWPMLQRLKGGAVMTTPQMADLLAQDFNLDEKDKNALLPSGIQTSLINRVGWAGFHLYKAGLVAKPKRGHWQITAAGEALAAKKPQRLDRHSLMQFPAFQNYITALQQKNSDEDLEKDESEEGELAPQEQAEKAINRLKSQLKDELLALVLKMDPVKFERLVLDLLLAMGYGGSLKEAAKTTKLSNDEGIDGIINHDRLGLDVIYIQAKRWQASVGRKEIQSFVGALAGQQANKGVFITTSDFSQTARDYVRSIAQKVILVDGSRLCDLMIEHNIGVTPVVKYEVKRVDSDYFDGF